MKDQSHRTNGTGTLPKANIAPEHRPSQRERIIFQPSIFRGYVSVREGMFTYILLICYGRLVGKYTMTIDLGVGIKS